MKKCPKCDLKNLDHLTACIECGTNLETERTESTKANYIPPRSGKFKTLKLSFYKIQRSFGSLDSGGRSSNPAIAGRDFIADVSETGKGFFRELIEVLSQSAPVLYSVIPGVGHLCQKRLKRGGIVAGIYFISLLLGIFFYGRIFSNICFGVMLTAHAVAFFDCLPISLALFKTIRSRLITMGMIFLLVLVSYRAIYLSVNEKISGKWVSFKAEPVFTSGDFVLIKNQDKYQRGDIVFFNSNAAGQIYRNGGNEYYRLRNGTYCDRVIGLPGEHIEIKDNKIFINSIALSEKFQPLRKILMRPMQCKLQENEYFVYYSLHNTRQTIPTNLLLLHNVVSEDNIKGKAFMIYAPLNRMKLIE